MSNKTVVETILGQHINADVGADGIYRQLSTGLLFSSAMIKPVDQDEREMSDLARIQLIIRSINEVEDCRGYGLKRMCYGYAEVMEVLPSKSELRTVQVGSSYRSNESIRIHRNYNVVCSSKKGVVSIDITNKLGCEVTWMDDETKRSFFNGLLYLIASRQLDYQGGVDKVKELLTTERLPLGTNIHPSFMLLPTNGVANSPIEYSLLKAEEHVQKFKRSVKVQAGVKDLIKAVREVVNNTRTLNTITVNTNTQFLKTTVFRLHYNADGTHQTYHVGITEELGSSRTNIIGKSVFLSTTGYGTNVESRLRDEDDKNTLHAVLEYLADVIIQLFYNNDLVQCADEKFITGLGNRLLKAREFSIWGLLHESTGNKSIQHYLRVNYAKTLTLLQEIQIASSKDFCTITNSDKEVSTYRIVERNEDGTMIAVTPFGMTQLDHNGNDNTVLLTSYPS